MICFVPRARKPGIPTLVRAKEGLLDILETAQVTVKQGWFDLFVSNREKPFSITTVRRAIASCKFYNFKMCILDVNECDNGTHDCNQEELAICNNTIGSFTCHCKPGFIGDGKNCSGTVIFLATTYCSHST